MDIQRHRAKLMELHDDNQAAVKDLLVKTYAFWTDIVVPEQNRDRAHVSDAEWAAWEAFYEETQSRFDSLMPLLAWADRYNDVSDRDVEFIKSIANRMINAPRKTYPLPSSQDDEIATLSPYYPLSDRDIEYVQRTARRMLLEMEREDNPTQPVVETPAQDDETSISPIDYWGIKPTGIAVNRKFAVSEKHEEELLRKALKGKTKRWWFKKRALKKVNYAIVSVRDYLNGAK